MPSIRRVDSMDSGGGGGGGGSSSNNNNSNNPRKFSKYNVLSNKQTNSGCFCCLLFITLLHEI